MNDLALPKARRGIKMNICSVRHRFRKASAKQSLRRDGVFTRSRRTLSSELIRLNDFSAPFGLLKS